jgi:intracellular sulfur oxidation DsrE/DsrF family protein
MPANTITTGVFFSEMKGEDPAKILIHISDRDKWRFVLNQIARLMEVEKGSKPDVRIIADGFAVGVCIACDRMLREQMADFVRGGGRLLGCEESLRFLNMKPENLPDFIGAVPNGMEEIIRLQRKGFQYIKA